LTIITSVLIDAGGEGGIVWAQEISTQGTLDTTNQQQLQDLSNQVSPISIIIDNNREGWEQAIAYTSDPGGDNGNIGQIDWKAITLAHDCDDLYVRYEVSDGPAFTPDGFRYNLLVDVDNNPMTGYKGPGKWLSIGADVLIQGGQDKVTTFKFMGGTDQEAWGWQQINFYPVSDKVVENSKRDIEYRINISDLNVFDNGVNSFDWVAWADHSSAILDFYPDGGNLGDIGSFNRYTFNYIPTTERFANPERGFFEATRTYSSLYKPLDLPTLQCYRQNEGISLIHRYFYLESYVNSDISQQFLDMMQADFDIIRQAGLKVIPRFVYSETAGPNLTPPYGDASKERILFHLSQLSNVLRSNSDVIAAMEAGFIGLWGEWWYSDHFQPDSAWSDRGEVLFAILDVLPTTRAVQLRAPRYKQNIFGDDTPVDFATAFNGSDKARTGHHNDCFVSSMSDGGTYVDPITEYPYMEEETKWVPMGGETCDYNAIFDPDLNRLKCAAALDELARFHWSYLNLDWYKPVLRKWVDEGCFSEIERRLGYHLIFLQGTYDNLIKPGSNFKFSLQIKNEGFSAPFNPRTVELILRHSDGSVHTFKLPNDPMTWLPGQTHTIAGEINIPENFPEGDYELLLNLPDPEPDLYQRPEYSIRLANEKIWEAETGYNKLNHSVIAKPTAIYFPDTINIIVGKYDWGNTSSLLAPDNDTFDIKAMSEKGGKTTDWYASTTIPALPLDKVSKIIVTYAGQFSKKAVTQEVFLYNYKNASWDLVDTRAVGNTDDVVVQVALSNAADYFSLEGKSSVRVRGYKKGKEEFFSWANYLSWEIQ
jgi:hypothetical protein